MTKRSFGADDELPRVGYGNPPQHSRFRKGTSGNPAGRPKGTSRLTAREKLLRKKVVLSGVGKRRRVPVEEALYMQLVQLAFEGDFRARRDLLHLLQQENKHQDSKLALPSASKPRVIFMKDSTELLLALGISIELEGRLVLSGWAIEAARQRQVWAPLSPKDGQLLEEFGETSVHRAA